jgi:glycosyltransferase involved in cell wall biosynthesis
LALPELKRQAAAEPADWFIAHTQAGLPVAAWAAQRWNARLGFDCEDLLSEGTRDPVEIVKVIERSYLRRCNYISIPSTAMARRLEAIYNVPRPTVLYNVFPLRLADGMEPPSQRPPHPSIRLHWFSQTIGPDRGIEDAVQALQWVGDGVELHLRGQIGGNYRSQLDRLAANCGARDRLFFHPLVDHDELIRTISAFDIGLALERPDDPNYSLTVTNKVFSYLLAGLPVVATQTPGHREALSRIPSASIMYAAGDARELAACLGPWLRNPGRLRTAQQCAWEVARETFCWERESTGFLDLLSGSNRVQPSPYMNICAES